MLHLSDTRASLKLLNYINYRLALAFASIDQSVSVLSPNSRRQNLLRGSFLSSHACVEPAFDIVSHDHVTMINCTHTPILRVVRTMRMIYTRAHNISAWWLNHFVLSVCKSTWRNGGRGGLSHIWCGGPCCLLSLFDWDIIFILNIYRMFWKMPCP
jgi:hypothetical protein